MTKIGIMGGTFDPIHIGHLIAAEQARASCGLDEVWFIPTYGSPLKVNQPSASGEQRFEMVCESIQGHSAFRALDIELKRGGVSYSYDTVKELMRLYPECEFAYIIGSDRIHDLPQWHKIEQLAKLITFIGLERPSEPLESVNLPAFLNDRLTLVSMPPIGISSTDIRSKLASGSSIRYFVSEEVYRYIRRYGLYESKRND